MNFVEHADILVLGLTVAAIGILGFVVFFNDRRSATNRIFLLFTMTSVVWGVLNFAAYQATTAEQSLWLWRAVIFTAVWFCLSIYTLAKVFPQESYTFSRFYSYVLAPYVVLVSFLTLTPTVFVRLLETPRQGLVPIIENGPLIPLFGITVVFLVIAAIFTFVQKMRRGNDEERHQIRLIMFGTGVTFTLLICFNFILPTAFGMYAFIPYGAIFILPFIASTAYAIMRYHLFNTRLIAAELFSFFLTVSTLLQIVFSASFFELIFRASAFLLVLAISILLIRSVIQEVRLREEVQELSNQKSEFMTFASHEIRNPITAMRGYASLIADGTAGAASEEVRGAARKVLVEGNDVLNLISQFLAKSKLELGQLSYANESYDLGATVALVVDGYIPHAQERGLTLRKHIDLSQSLLVRGDAGKTKEVVSNLIDNAIKYTKRGGVTVSVERIGESIRVEIIDTGVGIPERTMANLFKKFSRADAQKMNLLGTGLGLYLGKTFIESQGGKLWVESDGGSKGSRFIIEFPAA